MSGISTHFAASCRLKRSDVVENDVISRISQIEISKTLSSK